MVRTAGLEPAQLFRTEVSSYQPRLPPPRHARSQLGAPHLVFTHFTWPSGQNDTELER